MLWSVVVQGEPQLRFAAQRRFAASTMRCRPSGLRRRFRRFTCLVSLAFAPRALPPSAFAPRPLCASALLLTFGVASVAARPQMSPLMQHYPDS